VIAPYEFHTDRLVIRRWQLGDAVELAPVLAANVDHLAPWIPWRVAEPLPATQLTTRLEEFGAAFDADREWRYAILDSGAGRILGDVALFPRNATGRVPFDSADHVEMGYWLRADATGRGYATEAAAGALDIARALPAISRVLIRCDERNVASAAIPRRLGFRLVTTVIGPGVRPDEPECRLQEWEYMLDSAAPGS
jgi:RimJ/RimL family protein N-acetyltransferase